MLQDLHDRGIYLTEDEYRTGLRTLFPEDYQDFSDEELEDIIYQRIAQLSPSEAESLMEGLGSWLKKAVSTVAPVITAALPTVAGAVGTAFGGPLGGAAAGFAGNLAAGAISKATKTKPNQFVSNVGQAASSIASGNYRGAVPSLVNVSRDVGNAISRGAGDKVARIASNAAQAATSIAGGDYRGAVPGIINMGREVGNAVSPGAGNRIANVASNVAQTTANIAGNNGARLTNQTQASAQLLSFLKSTPLLQSILSSIVTGSVGTGLQIPKEDGSATSTSYVEMLEALKHLTDNAIIEADNAGFTTNLQIESEAEGETYIESIIEDVSNYENSLLPNYDVITY